MDQEQRRQLRQLIDEWYQLIVDGKPGAAAAAKKLVVLARADPKDYARLARKALSEAGLGIQKESDCPTSPGGDG